MFDLGNTSKGYRRHLEGLPFGKPGRVVTCQKAFQSLVRHGAAVPVIDNIPSDVRLPILVLGTSLNLRDSVSRNTSRNKRNYVQ